MKKGGKLKTRRAKCISTRGGGKENPMLAKIFLFKKTQRKVKELETTAAARESFVKKFPKPQGECGSNFVGKKRGKKDSRFGRRGKRQVVLSENGALGVNRTKI